MSRFFISVLGHRFVVARSCDVTCSLGASFNCRSPTRILHIFQYSLGCYFVVVRPFNAKRRTVLVGCISSPLTILETPSNVWVLGHEFVVARSCEANFYLGADNNCFSPTGILHIFGASLGRSVVVARSFIEKEHTILAGCIQY